MNKPSENDQRLITSDMIKKLPPPVQRYMAYTGVIGYPWINTVYLKQLGKFRQKPDQPWLPLIAEEFYAIDPPSLIWNASFRIAGLPLLRAKDKYESGHGHMYGKLAGLITIFDVRGDELDQATMIRYLNEMMWFPTAFLGENIRWEEIDNHSAQVTFSDHGKSVSAQMSFDDSGCLTNFTAMRYRELNGEFLLNRWSTPILDYGKCAGLQLPIHGQAVWNLESGDLPYIDLAITKVKYNAAAQHSVLRNS